MAVTAIWSIKNRFDKVIDYAANPEKTVETNAKGMADFHMVDNVIEYAADDMKTEECKFVTALNVDLEQAKEQFRETKLHYNKTDGILAFHAYQSFAPGETDAKTAHEIGVKLAEELWNDHEVIVATHCNTGCYHNHFVINSVSINTGRKFYANKDTYRKMREASDRLCREYGLSVVEHPQGKTRSYGEWLAEKEGKPTLRSTIREAIDEAIAASLTIYEFLDVMNDMGFVIDQSGKHPKLKRVGSERFVRFKSLGPGYSVEDIFNRVAGNDTRRFEDFEEQEDPQAVFEGERDKPENMDFIAVNRCYYRALTITKERPKTNVRMYYLVRRDHSAMRLYQDQLHVVSAHKLESEKDVLSYMEKARSEIDSLTDTRRKLRNDLKRAERLSEPDRTNLTAEIRLAIKECSRQLSVLRREMTSYDEVLKQIDRMRENLMRIDQEKFRGEEAVSYEPISGRGRSDRESEHERK